MNRVANEEQVQTLAIEREIHIAASPEIAFEAMLDQIGPHGDMPDGTPFPMVLEAWPGGRWYRDLGNKTGHLWGHVQVIKPPTLLEICGPMFMSYPAISHVQYRFVPEVGGTLLRLTHKAIGLIIPDHREGVVMGWEHELEKIRKVAERMRDSAGSRGR